MHKHLMSIPIVKVNQRGRHIYINTRNDLSYSTLSNFMMHVSHVGWIILQGYGALKNLKLHTVQNTECNYMRFSEVHKCASMLAIQWDMGCIPGSVEHKCEMIWLQIQNSWRDIKQAGVKLTWFPCWFKTFTQYLGWVICCFSAGII